MHYNAYAFAIDYNYPTITPRDPNISPSRLGQRGGLSNGDIAAVSYMYGEPPASNNKLVNGVAINSIWGNQGNTQYFTIEVPQGAKDLSFNLSGGTGDADLYIGYNSAPTLNNYWCRSWNTGNNEACGVAAADAGTYHVMIHGYEAYNNAKLVASFSTSSSSAFENTNNFTIPDNNSNGVYTPIDVNVNSTTRSVEVGINIVHTYKSDLIVSLLHPDGTVYTLHNRTGGSNDNIYQAYTIDIGNKNPNGTWYLHTADYEQQDTGYIDSWYLAF